jgi:C-terminal processing protease CtpA/Prc
MKLTLKTCLLSGLATGLLAACGGSSSSPTPVVVAPPPPPPVVTGPVFRAGVFDPASDFKDKCESPRAGTADQSGSSLEEKFWLRSWTNETYLWYDEVTDRDPGSISDVLAYFETQKTEATTASGAPKDSFHFSQDTADYEASRNGEAVSGYGAVFRLLASAPPRDIRVAYTQADTPAGAADGFRRGDVILTIDGADAIDGNEVQTLNDGLFPRTAGETHVFTVRGTDQVERTVTINSADVVRDPVTDTNVVDTPTGKVGYIHFTTFSPFNSEEAIVDAMVEMDDAGVDDLVLDLRYNGGGLLAVAAQTGYMIAGDARTSGKTFDRLTFSDKNPTINPVTGRALTPTPFYSTGLNFTVNTSVQLPELDLDTVYILTTSGTCSASEAVINGLRGVDVNVVLIGSTTCGKPYGFYPTDNCGETFFTIQFRGANDKGFGDYADGFQPEGAGNGFGVTTPGCPVSDDFTGVLGDADEPLFAAALQYREDGTCPTTTVAKADAQTNVDLWPDNPADLRNDPRIALQEFLATSRIDGLAR